MKKRRLSKLDRLAMSMPAMSHNHEAGQPFDVSRSEIARWLATQPEVVMHFINIMRSRRHVVFCPESREWMGVKWAKENGISINFSGKRAVINEGKGSGQ